MQHWLIFLLAQRLNAQSFQNDSKPSRTSKSILSFFEPTQELSLSHAQPASTLVNRMNCLQQWTFVSWSCCGQSNYRHEAHSSLKSHRQFQLTSACYQLTLFRFQSAQSLQKRCQNNRDLQYPLVVLSSFRHCLKLLLLLHHHELGLKFCLCCYLCLLNESNPFEF